MVDKPAKASNPVEQVTQSMQTVAAAFQTAGHKAVSGQQEITQCAMKQAQDNATKLMETLKSMASNRDPSKIANTYSQFVTDAAMTNARQLMELGQVMAKTSQETWGPVIAAMTAAAKRSD